MPSAHWSDVRRGTNTNRGVASTTQRESASRCVPVRACALPNNISTAASARFPRVSVGTPSPSNRRGSSRGPRNQEDHAAEQHVCCARADRASYPVTLAEAISPRIPRETVSRDASKCWYAAAARLSGRSWSTRLATSPPADHAGRARSPSSVSAHASDCSAATRENCDYARCDALSRCSGIPRAAAAGLGPPAASADGSFWYVVTWDDLMPTRYRASFGF